MRSDWLAVQGLKYDLYVKYKVSGFFWIPASILLNTGAILSAVSDELCQMLALDMKVGMFTSWLCSRFGLSLASRNVMIRFPK